MSEPIYLFKKTLEQRLEEFKDVLCSRPPPVLASEIADEWSYSLQVLIEPGGWQALWKISRQICQELKLSFPKCVYVKVISVDFKELTANVEVERVPDGILIPMKQEVPLTQLYPTISQENSALKADFTAKIIDQLRFFYTYLWCPWDIEDSDGIDWPGRFLEPRLQLFYEMSNGTIPAKLVDRIQGIREQACKLYEEKRELEMLLSSVASGEPNIEDISSPTSQDSTYQLMQIHVKLSPLLTELQLLENPSMRKLVIRQNLEETETKKGSSNAILVWQGGPVDEFCQYLSSCKKVVHPGTSVVSLPSFQSAVETAVAGNAVLLPKGVHHSNLNIESDLSIIGVGEDIPEISRKENGSYLWVARNAKLKLENLKLNARNVANALLVYKNSMITMINCEIISGDCIDGRGVVVQSGGSVVIDGCTFSGLNVAVCCYPGSQVCIQNSKIQNCAIGVEVYENSILKMIECSVANSERAALFISQNTGINRRGTLELLEKFKEINVSDLELTGNKSDVELVTEFNPQVA